jgi:hypothetical protein
MGCFRCEEHWSGVSPWAVFKFQYQALFCTSGTSMRRLSRAGHAGRLTPRRTTCALPGGRTSPCRLLLPRRSASRLGPPGPGGPRFARRCSQRPRWSRLSGVGGDVGHVTSAPPAPDGTRWVSGRPLVPCDHGVTTKGVAPQLCCLGSERGRVRALRCDLEIELVWHSVNCPWAKQVLAGGVLDGVGLLCEQPLRRDTLLVLHSPVLLQVGPALSR